MTFHDGQLWTAEFDGKESQSVYAYDVNKDGSIDTHPVHLPFLPQIELEGTTPDRELAGTTEMQGIAVNDRYIYLSSSEGRDSEGSVLTRIDRHSGERESIDVPSNMSEGIALRGNDLITTYGLGDYQIRIDAAVHDAMIDRWVVIRDEGVWRRDLAHALARATGVFALSLASKSRLHFFGAYADVVQAEYLFEIIEGRIDRECERYLQAWRRVRVVGANPVGSTYGGGRAGRILVDGVGTAWPRDFWPETFDPTVVDEVHTVEDGVVYRTLRRLAAEEALLLGPSSALAVATALRLAREADPGSVIVAVAPDGGINYLTKAFDDAWLTAAGVGVD